MEPQDLEMPDFTEYNPEASASILYSIMTIFIKTAARQLQERYNVLEKPQFNTCGNGAAV